MEQHIAWRLTKYEAVLKSIKYGATYNIALHAAWIGIKYEAKLSMVQH